MGIEQLITNSNNFIYTSPISFENSLTIIENATRSG